jgi:hypothetical protein
MATEIVGRFQVTTLIKRRSNGVWYGRYKVARLDDTEATAVFEGICPNAPDFEFASIAAMAVGREKAQSLDCGVQPVQ